MRGSATVDRIAREEAVIAGCAIDAYLALHANIRDLFPEMPALRHRDLLALIANDLQAAADTEPAVCELVPKTMLEQVRAATERVTEEARKHWADDRIRRELYQLRAAVDQLPRS